MKHPRPFQLVLIASLLVAGLFGIAMLRGCSGGLRLVEVFDNGPVGGPPGASEGYRWVGMEDRPSPGKSWKPVDPATLTDEERKRIR